MSTCQDVGEFGLITRLRQWVPSTGASVVRGIGDDAAVIRWKADQLLLATVDGQVENTHFRWEWTTPEKLGRKLAAINLSDLTAMGGTPLYALVNLVLPPETPVTRMEAFYRGLAKELEAVSAAIVGGNFSAGAHFAADLILMGGVLPEQLKSRAGAKKGDLLCVTGTLGKGAAGLALAKSGSPATQEEMRLLEFWQVPRARVRAGRILAACSEVHAVIDISDGLAADLFHLIEAGSVGAVVDERRLPVDPAVPAVAEKLGQSALEWGLFGGEEYELLFAVAEEAMDAPLKKIKTVAPVSVIGRIVEAEAGVQLKRANGRTVPLTPGGWNHFRQLAASSMGDLEKRRI